jgi:hypothetical protein
MARWSVSHIVEGREVAEAFVDASTARTAAARGIDVLMSDGPIDRTDLTIRITRERPRPRKARKKTKRKKLAKDTKKNRFDSILES